ncbi:tetratricopeptide repeat protein [bacterium]|nr:tetratricopeptide repeat protein [bacterium]
MISINPITDIKTFNSAKASNPVFKGGEDIDALLDTGDKALNENNVKDALQTYKKALSLAPNNVLINKKIAKAYSRLKDFKSAEENFKIYVKNNQNDADAWIDLGESQRQKGDYSNAMKSFETAKNLDGHNDVAKRSIQETQNNVLSIFQPRKAYEEKQSYAQNNLQTALQMATEYMTPEYMKSLADVQIKFGETASMGGTPNIAQYENAIKTITVSNTYKYAAPEVIAAYIVHESVHAKDKDPYTSIREEQDAYTIATKFWIENANGIKDPEMDYAADLYRKSPETLNKRVEEIYVLRDPSIAKTSPNHPPHKKTFFNLFKTKAASQPLTSYNVIA